MWEGQEAYSDLVLWPILVWSGGGDLQQPWLCQGAATWRQVRGWEACCKYSPSKLTFTGKFSAVLKTGFIFHFSFIATWKFTQIVPTLELRRDVSTELHRESVELDLTQFWHCCCYYQKCHCQIILFIFTASGWNLKTRLSRTPGSTCTTLSSLIDWVGEDHHFWKILRNAKWMKNESQPLNPW